MTRKQLSDLRIEVQRLCQDLNTFTNRSALPIDTTSTRLLYGYARVINQVEQDAEQGKWKNPSISAAVMIKIPFWLLTLSVWAFLIALGIYLGFVWTDNLDPQSYQSGSQAVFATFMVMTILCIYIDGFPELIKEKEMGPVQALLKELGDLNLQASTAEAMLRPLVPKLPSANETQMERVEVDESSSSGITRNESNRNESNENGEDDQQSLSRRVESLVPQNGTAGGISDEPRISGPEQSPHEAPKPELGRDENEISPVEEAKYDRVQKNRSPLSEGGKGKRPELAGNSSQQIQELVDPLVSALEASIRAHE